MTDQLTNLTVVIEHTDGGENPILVYGIHVPEDLFELSEYGHTVLDEDVDDIVKKIIAKERGNDLETVIDPDEITLLFAFPGDVQFQWDWRY